MASAERLIEVFNEAKARPAGAERDQFLSEACQGDLELKEQVLSLLQAHEGAGEFLQNTQFIPTVTPLTEKPGDRIGRYKLLQQIGEGGCGVVYMAEQEEPVRRRVALKVIKLGMDTKQVIARFEAERQALALMDHPNIAKVFDAGATETGRPFFVMELVRGIKITDYCDQNNLSTKERLELFIQVCQAIQHAHQKGIIHRDIKPSNILVTQHDDVAVPKVIDFGIAKATVGQLTDKTVFTAFAQFMGTPAYMSPEQAQMSGLDIDTRADIYSLGVLLYELLTGNTPFAAKDLLAAGLDEMRRKIREDEPARPSTCLSTMTAIDLTTVAKHRHVEPPRLIHLIRGDLDWLVMKCLEKDRTRRYETANALATDLQRHLNDEPVVACPPSNFYRLQKLVRRNKLAFAAASAVIAALVIGLGVSTWMFFKEKHSRQRAVAAERNARTQAAKATAVSDFLQEMLRSADPFTLKGSDYTVRQLLDDFSAGLGRRLVGQPEVEATVRATIANAYRGLGVTDKAEPHLERALALRRRIYGEQSAEVAQSLVHHAWNLFEQERLPEAEAEARRALDIYNKPGTDALPVIDALCALQGILMKQRRFQEVEAAGEEALALARNSPERDFPRIPTMMHTLAEVKVQQAKYVDAENLALQAVELSRRLQGSDHPEMGWSLFALGEALRGQHKLAEAERAFREVLSIWRKCYSLQDKRVKQATRHLYAVLEAKGDPEGLAALARQRFTDANQRIERYEADAEAWMERAIGHVALKLWKAAMADYGEAIARFKDMDPTKRAAVGVGCLELAQHAFAAAQYETAERASQQAITVLKQLVQENPQGIGYPQHLGHSQWQLGQALQKTGRPDKAEKVYLEALQVFEKAARDFPAEYYFRQEQAFSQRFLAEAVNGLGRVDDAERHYRAAIALYAALAADAPQNMFYHQEEAYTTWLLAAILERASRPDAAAIESRKVIALYEKAIAKFPDNAGFRLSLVGLLSELGKLAEAETLCREALAMRKKQFGDLHREVEVALGSLARALHRGGKLAEAEAVWREELAMERKLSGEEHPFVANSLHQLATVLRDSGKWSEAEAMFREALGMRRKLLGNENLTVANSLSWLGTILSDQGKHAEAEAVYRETLALQRKLPADDPQLADALARLTRTLLVEQKFTEAETTIRECLTLREKKLPDDWLTFNIRSMLGGSLLGQKKFAEAEPLLLSGYEGMKQRADKIPAGSKRYVKETLQHLVQLYEATGQSEKAAEWNKKLAEFDKAAEAGKKTVAPKP